MFTDYFIKEQEDKFSARLAILKERYGWTVLQQKFIDHKVRCHSSKMSPAE